MEQINGKKVEVLIVYFLKAQASFVYISNIKISQNQINLIYIYKKQ